jgi:hypothetical protein
MATMQPLDDATRASLRRYVTTAHWRRAIRELGVSEGVIRRALQAGVPIRLTSARAIRLGLYMSRPAERQP